MMSKPRPLDGKIALVTGAGRGIGRAVAIELSSIGAKVALVARSRDQLRQTAQEVEAQAGNALVVSADVGRCAA